MSTTELCMKIKISNVNVIHYFALRKHDDVGGESERLIAITHPSGSLEVYEKKTCSKFFFIKKCM